jgi:iron complex transport system substrate-binding protein
MGKVCERNEMKRLTHVLFACVAAIAALALVGALVAGCSGSDTASKGTGSKTTGQAHNFPVTLTDDASRTVTVKKRAERIVSLAPANTEIVAALGLEKKLVGVTTYDDYPPSVKSLPKIGDFMNPNVEAIAAARPDLILVTTGVQGDVLAKLEALGAPVIAVDPSTVDGVLADIGKVGSATDTKAEATDLIAKMRGQIAAIEGALATRSDSRPVSVFLEIGQNPLYAVGAGTLLDDLVKRAGGTNIVAKPGYVAYSTEQVLKDDPDVYLSTLGSMGDPANIQKGPLKALRAAKEKRVYVLDENLVTRPGPRITEGLLVVAKALYPDVQFPTGQ